MSRPAPASPPRPLQGVATRQIVIGGLLVLAGLGMTATFSWATGVSMLAFGALLGGAGLLLRRSAGALPLVNGAFDAAQAGRVAEAQRLLDQAEAGKPQGYLQRVIDLQRANLALRRGDLDAALARADAAVARPPWWAAGTQDRLNQVGARAMRALIRAARGDHEGTLADVAAVRADELATPDARARAEVAFAMVAAKEPSRATLAAHLEKERRLLLEHTTPRERAVVRAFQRLVEAPRTTVYREPAPREPARAPGAEPTVADWVAQVAPAAAAHARAARLPAPSAEAAPASPEPSAPEHEKAATARVAPAPKRMLPKVLALWVLVVMLCLAIWQLLNPPQQVAVAEVVTSAPAFPVDLVTGGSFLAILAFIALRVVWQLRAERRMAAAFAGVSRDDPAAIAEMERHARARNKTHAAQAMRELSRLAVRRGDFATALARCDAGIAAAGATEVGRAVASAILLPDLVAERAFVLAVTGEPARARAEMKVLAQQFPDYPFRARAELRVELVLAVRRGDLAGAARLVQAAEDVPLSMREEMLADLARATAHPEAAGAAEVARLEKELRVDPELARWIEAVAPALPGAFAKARQGAVEAEREAEAEAEEEAHAALAEERPAVG